MNNILEEKTIIAGPCSAESEEQLMCTAESLYKQGIRIFRAGVWKPRTRPGGFEGYGEKALQWMAKVKAKFPDMKLATEVAKPDHISLCIKYGIDIIWIGARTTASPFAVQDLADVFTSRLDIADRFDMIYVKNPVNPDIQLWIGAIERLQRAGVKNLGAIHRGFCLYDNKVYRNVPTWQIPMDLKKTFPHMKILCDPSHIGGKRELIEPLCQQAISLGLDGLMVECHCNPDQALTDAKQQVSPDVFGYILANIQDRVSQMLESSNIVPEEEAKAAAVSLLRMFRDNIDLIDDEIIYKLSERFKNCRDIAKVKRSCGMPVFQESRYKEVLEKFKVKAGSLGLNEDMAEQIFATIHEESVRQQTEIAKS